MKARLPLFLFALVALAGLAWLAAPRDADAAEPPGNVSAVYSGKGSSRNFVIVDEEPGTGGFGLQAAATQEGNNLELILTISPPDEESFQWTLYGRVGNGNFWVEGDVGEGERVVLSGTAKGTPGKLSLKGQGVFLAGTHYSTLKIAVKQLTL